MSFPFKAPPMGHQTRGLKKAWPHKYFAYFWSMGAGKTFAAINLAAARFMTKQIDRVLVVCPTPIKSVWSKEMAKWAPCDVDPFILESGQDKALDRWISNKSDALRVLCVGIEALSQGKAADLAEKFVKEGTCMMIVDESSKIKTHSATRTKKCITLGSLSEYRLILTGTPVTQGLHDLFAQMQFLHTGILNCKSYFQFKNMYCVMGGFENRSIIGYQRREELMELISPYVDVVTKEDALPDLPPKVYQTIEVELTKEQKVAIEELKQIMRTESEGKELTVNTVLERLTRYQQIIGGNFPFNDEETGGYGVTPIPGKNPKLDALVELIEPLEGEKVIIWARFRPELQAISERLASIYGKEAVAQFWGDISPQGRSAFTDLFQQRGSGPRFMVSNQSVGGMGQTWTAATVVVYFSNSFSYEDRMQSEDRAHRKGQENKVAYFDLVANHPADKMVVKALAKKGDVAGYVTSSLKDEEWIK